MLESIVQHGEKEVNVWWQPTRMRKNCGPFPCPEKAGPLPGACEAFLAHITSFLLSFRIAPICQVCFPGQSSVGNRSACTYVCRSPE